LSKGFPGTTQETTHAEAFPESGRVGHFLVRALECGDLAAGASRHAIDRMAEVRLERGERAHLRTNEDGRNVLTLRIPDPKVSARHARFVQHEGLWTFEDLGSTNGSRIDGERVTSTELGDGALIEVGSTLLLFRECRAPTWLEADKVVRGSPNPVLDTLSVAQEEAMRRLRRVAASPLPVLLSGETGTGKEVLAHEVHVLSKRAGPFVPVNCGALPESLMEAQLFGHTRGAFTGAARDEVGFVRSAEGGTLFLDEIADLHQSSQAALLRVLQNGEVTPVGSARPVHADVRIVAATHKDLDTLMQQGLFRRDLYARLAGYVHALPSLQDRQEDLGLLVAALLLRHARGAKVELRVETARALFAYAFPLNVRELEQCLSAAIVLAAGAPITPSHLPDKIRAARTSRPPAAESLADRTLESLSPEDSAIRDALAQALSESGGNVSEAARRMGKARQQAQRWLRRFGMDPQRFRKP
jgi:DNA-binding NtrC family response regulator